MNELDTMLAKLGAHLEGAASELTALVALDSTIEVNLALDALASAMEYLVSARRMLNAPAAPEREPLKEEPLSGDLAQAYMVHVSDGQGPLFYVRVRPEPTIWLRAGATAADVATAYLAAERGSEREPLKGERPKVVCLCGSSRFVAEMACISWALERDEGAIVLSLHLLPQWYPHTAPDHQAEAEGKKEHFDELHLRKIDLADQVLVVNIGGYIGESTRREIAYAEAHGKPVRYLESAAECGPVAPPPKEGK